MVGLGVLVAVLVDVAVAVDVAVGPPGVSVTVGIDVGPVGDILPVDVRGEVIDVVSVQQHPCGVLADLVYFSDHARAGRGPRLRGEEGNEFVNQRVCIGVRQFLAGIKLSAHRCGEPVNGVFDRFDQRIPKKSPM